jgi:hypothetical protein
MHRPKRALVLSILLMAFLAALGTASAQEAAGLPTVTGEAPAVQPCGLDLAALSSPKEEACRTVAPSNPEPEFMAARRYCRCGCGARCSTDADCGPGGSCVGFITCC